MAHLGLEPIKAHSAGVPNRFYVPMLSADCSSWRNTVDARPNGFPRVTFDWANTRPGYGIHVLELAARGAGPAITEILTNPMISHWPRLDWIVFIFWPGYPNFKYARTIDITTKDGPFTRGQLAATIGMHFLRFIDKLEAECVQPGMTRFELKRGGRLQLENVVLMSIYNSGPADVYQAEVQLEFRR